MSETAIRKRLKDCAEYVKGGEGTGGGYWTTKSGEELPSEDKLILLVTPEMVCMNEAMLAGQVRLDSLGVETFATMAGFVLSFSGIDLSDKIKKTIKFIEKRKEKYPME